jgi:hypothetical protein
VVLRVKIRLPARGFGDTGLDEWPSPSASALLPRVNRDNEMVKRLMWSGLMAAIGAVATIAANRVAVVVWRRLFDEDPPE